MKEGDIIFFVAGERDTVATILGRVRLEIAGMMELTKGSDALNFLWVVDFTKGKVPEGAAVDWTPSLNLNVPTNVKLTDKRVMANPETGGWRAFFKMDVTSDVKLVEMNCELTDGKQPISERWTYQWKR